MVGPLAPATDLLTATAPASLRDAVRQSMSRVGAASVPGLLTAQAAGELRAESGQAQPRSERSVRTAYELYADGRSLRSPASYRVAKPGPVLQSVHGSRPLLNALQAAIGKPLRPTRSAYIYYQPGDFMGLHTDLPECYLTVLMPTVGEPGPLWTFPADAGVSRHSLGFRSRAAGGVVPGGTAVALPDRGALLIYGHVVPHQRRPVPPGPAVGVASLCFAKVEPAPGEAS